jgi:hypothetical protein
MKKIIFFSLYACLWAAKSFAFIGYNDSLATFYSKVVMKIEVEQDMEFMIRTIEHVHPNPFHSISKQKLYNLKDHLLNNLKDSMTQKEAWHILSRLTAAINEGHTSMIIPKELKAKVKSGDLPVFPFTIKGIDEEGMIIESNLSGDTDINEGTYIQSINGIPTSEIFKNFCQSYGGSDYWKAGNFINIIRYYLPVAGILSPYTVVYKTNGDRRSATVTGITESQLLNGKQTQGRDAYTYERIGDIGYINFKSMGGPLNEFKDFLNKTFSEIKDHPVSGLIIDIRKNSGGSSKLGEILLTYVTDKPFELAGGMRWKVSQEYKNYLLSVDSSASRYSYMGKPNGSIIEYSDIKLLQPENNPLRYAGKVCILTGPFTYSSANMMAAAAKDFKLATLIGEPTGEPGNDYGEIYVCELPATKLSFFTSVKYFIRPNQDTKDSRTIQPDISVKQDKTSNTDTVLDVAIKWIGGMSEPGLGD